MKSKIYSLFTTIICISQFRTTTASKSSLKDPPISTICEEPKITSKCTLKSINTTEAIFLDLTTIESNKITITGINIKINSSEFKIKTNDKTKASLYLKNSTISSGDISIDFNFNNEKIETSILLDNSTLNVSATSNNEKGVNIGRMVSFAGGSVYSNTYGYPVIPKDYYNFVDGDNQKLIQNDFFRGSGVKTINEKDITVLGGGRVYIRAINVQFSGEVKGIVANGFQQADDGEGIILKNRRLGTGGVVFLTAKNLKISDLKEKERIIMAEGSNILKIHPQSIKDEFWKEVMLGGGGRIYIHVGNLDSSEKNLFNLISVKGYKNPKNDNIANSGTAWVRYSNTNALLIQGDPEGKYDTSKMIPTVIKDDINKEFSKLEYEIKIVNSKVKHLINTNITKLQFNEFHLHLGSIYYFEYQKKNNDLQGELNSPKTAVIRTNNNLFEKSSSLYLNLPSTDINITTVNNFMISDGSSIHLPLDSNTRISGPEFSLIGNSLIKLNDNGSPLSYSRSTNFLGLNSQVVKITGSSVIVDKLRISPKDKIVIEDSQISNIRSTCLNGADDDSVKRAKEMDDFVKKCKLRTTEDCSRNYQENYLGTSFSFIMIKIPKNNENLFMKNRILKVGYFALYSESDFILDENSIFNATASGCSSDNSRVDPAVSKYIKVCKVKGGSNLGRGTLGKGVNLELCKFLLPKQKKDVLTRLPLSGDGGQKSHQMEDSNRYGYGGGILNIFVDGTFTIKGKIKSNGFDSKKEAYTIIAAGAGGTIKISAKKIIFNIKKVEIEKESIRKFNITANGGKPDLEVKNYP